jgi:hypothetical protein
MEHDKLRHHFDRIGSHLHELCKEFAEVWILMHAEPRTDSTPINTPTPIVHETPVPAMEEKGRISSRQLGMLRKLCNEKIDGNWQAFDASCKARFGKSINYLTTKEASQLISEMIGGNHGHQSRSAR